MSAIIDENVEAFELAAPAADGPTASVARPRPRAAHYAPLSSIALVAGDIAVALLVAVYAGHISGISLAPILANEPALQAVAFAFVLWLVLFERIGMYRRSFSTNARDEVYATLAASVMAMAPALFIFSFLPSLAGYRITLVGTLALTAVGVSLTRFVAHYASTKFFPRVGRRVGIAGAPRRVRAVPQELSLTVIDEVVSLPVDDFDDEMTHAIESGDLGSLGWLHEALARDCDELIVTEALPAEIMPALLAITEARGVKLAFAPMRIRPHACDFSVRRDGGLALLYPRSLSVCTRGARRMRRVLDLAIAIPAIVLLSPVFAIIALAVYLDSGKPIFYKQIRVGRLGREFAIIKFRTMRTDAETKSGPVWAVPGEDRTTRVGRILRRTSLDELPQLFNVVRDEMSIVGPRPERPFYVQQFRKMLPRYDERHLVKPGITGWSHINMRRNVDASSIGERLSYDLFYLENWSIFMDVMIVCKTAAEVLFHSAA